MHPDAQQLVDRLGLAPHPEGGYFRETFRARLSLVDLPHGGSRSASTAIYFLLPAGSFSALHRVRSDEVWHHYAGEALDLHTLDEAGRHAVQRLGGDVVAGESPQIVVPAGLWQAAIPRGTRFSLCGCTVAPGFDFADFEMPTRATLLARFPAHAALVTLLTRAG